MRNAGLDKLQAGIKIGRRNINNLRYADDSTLMAESEEEIKSLLMRMKEESEKVSLKLIIKKKKKKKLRSRHLAQWQIEGENVEAVIDFLFLSSKITVYGACSHETGKQSLLGRKTKTKLDCVKKQRHHFANKDEWSRLWSFQ